MEHITLLGSEDVRTAAREITQAATTMRDAAGHLDVTVAAALLRLEELVSRFETAADRIAGKDGG